MSNEESHNNEFHIEGGHSFIQTPKQLAIVVFLAFAIPIALSVMISQLATSGMNYGANSAAMSPKAVNERLKPVGQLIVGKENLPKTETAAPAAASAAPKQEMSGKEVVAGTCIACHGTGALGAPKIGDKALWAPHIKKGLDTLIKDAIHGIGNMPPKGGNASLTEHEIASAIVYMANQSGANFKVPEEKSSSAPAANAPAPAAPAKTAPEAASPAPQATAPAAAAPTQGTQTASAGDLAKGKQVFQGTCIACHGAGLLGAPKAGDKAAWAPRIKTGMDALYHAALHGLNQMPPKGGNASLSDADVKSAVDYMVSLAQ
jgi:cytochrome c5